VTQAPRRIADQPTNRIAELLPWNLFAGPSECARLRPEISHKLHVTTAQTIVDDLDQLSLHSMPR
jgi:hypothetical protein